MVNDNSRASQYPRLVRPTPDPLGLFVRVGRNDHRELLSLIAQRDLKCFGLIFEATALKRHRELRELALATRLDAILDPRTQPAATLGGHNDEIGALPWGRDQPHMPDDFVGSKGRRIVAAIGDCVVQNGYTQVLAPTHLLQSSVDGWLSIDIESTCRLREYLDSAGGKRIQILYSLAIPYAIFRNPSERQRLVNAVSAVPADALWLRVDGLGARATPTGVRSYIEGTRDFAGLSIPIVADGIGGLAGLSLLAFGAVGGLAHGVTFGERVDNRSWRLPRTGKSFGRRRQIYVPELDQMLDPGIAEVLFRSNRARALFACRDSKCCRLGLRDMLEDPARHFLIQRTQQVASLAKAHLPLRAERFLEEQLRPVTDSLVQATNLRMDSVSLQESLRKQRKRLDALRVALAQMVRHDAWGPHVALPKTRMAREPRAGSSLAP